MTTEAAPPNVEQLLTFEGAHPGSNGYKDEAIRNELHLDPARYYQLLHRAIWLEEAVQIDAILTYRLRNQLAHRRNQQDQRIR